MERALLMLVVPLAFVVGCCVFSFLNVIIYRVPKKLSFVKGRSICPACSHVLGAGDLIPLLSYVALRGKCRYCKAKIGARDTLVELLGGILAAACVLKYAGQADYMAMATVFAFLCVLTVVTFMDWDCMMIWNECCIAAGIIGILSIVTMGNVSLISRIIGFFCLSVPMLALSLAVPGAFGGGDVKLMAACGIFLGWKLTLLSGAFAILLGGGYGIWLLAVGKKKRKDKFPFGPFLCMGMTVALFWGEAILHWYLGFFA